jgi:hypothetical protein
MKRLHLFCLFLLAAVVQPALAASPEAEAIIAKARAFIGGDAALDAVNSIHITGVLEVEETPANPNTPGKSSIEIIFQKPAHHLLTVRTAQYVETTGLDDYFSWRRVEPTDGGRAQNAGLGASGTKRLRASAWENLFFYRAAEKHGGDVIDQGLADVDGIRCRKILFTYGPGMEYLRYFDVETGRLVQTETPPSGLIREEGEIIVSGVRFPRVLKTYRTEDGKRIVVTVTFENIVLNKQFPPETFEQPLLRGIR